MRLPSDSVAPARLLAMFLLLYVDDVRARIVTYAGMRRIGLTSTSCRAIAESSSCGTR